MVFGFADIVWYNVAQPQRSLSDRVLVVELRRLTVLRLRQPKSAIAWQLGQSPKKGLTMCMGHTEDGVARRTDLRQALGDPTLEVGDNGDEVSLTEQAVYSEDDYDAEWEESESDRATLDWFSMGIVE